MTLIKKYLYSFFLKNKIEKVNKYLEFKINKDDDNE